MIYSTRIKTMVECVSHCIPAVRVVKIAAEQMLFGITDPLRRHSRARGAWGARKTLGHKYKHISIGMIMSHLYLKSSGWSCTLSVHTF